MPKEKGGKKNQAEKVEQLTEQKVLPIIEQYGYELWDVIFEKGAQCGTSRCCSIKRTAALMIPNVRR